MEMTLPTPSNACTHVEVIRVTVVNDSEADTLT